MVGPAETPRERFILREGAPQGRPDKMAVRRTENLQAGSTPAPTPAPMGG